VNTAQSRVSETGKGKEARGRDRRRDDRYVLNGAMGRLLYEWDNWPCEFVDISLSGCCLRLKTYFEPGGLAPVEVVVPLLGIQVRLRGVTQWVSLNGLTGVRFVYPSARAKNEFASLLSGLVDDTAAEVVKEAVNSAPEIKAKGLELSNGTVLFPRPPEGLEHADGRPWVADRTIDAEWEEVYRLRAEQDRLEGLEGQEEDLIAMAGGAAGRESEAAPDADSKDLASASAATAGEDDDERVANMSSEDWSATVRFLQNDAVVSGALADLGLTGCEFKMGGVYPGAPASRVEVEFQMRGLHFRLAGVTTAVVARHAAKIRFVEMSARRREELVQVLDELAEQNRREAGTG